MNSNERDDGGSAFPRTFERDSDSLFGGTVVVSQAGMSLRDYFAAKAMQGILSTNRALDSDAQFATDCYRFADAMLAARER